MVAAALTLSPAAGRQRMLRPCLLERSCMCCRPADRCLLPIAAGGGAGYGGGGGFGGSRYGDGGCVGHCSAGLEAGAGRRLGSICSRVAGHQATQVCMPCAHHQQILLIPHMQLRRRRWPVRRRWRRLGRWRRRWPVRGELHDAHVGQGWQTAVASRAHVELQPTAQLCCHGSPMHSCGGWVATGGMCDIQPSYWTLFMAVMLH